MPRDPEPPRDPVSDLISDFNKRFMVVNENGKALVYEPDHDAMLHRESFIRMEFADFRKLHMHQTVCVAIDEKSQPVMAPAADVWLKHPERRQFDRVVFDPGGRHAKGATLNLWRGFAVKPKQGSWARLRDHVFKVICSGNQDHFDYLYGWMARLVQHPDQPGETAIVMRGGEGTGKGTLARALLHILGQHGLTISNAKHLVGNFNGHLRDCAFLFADEAFYAGDKQHVGVLKALITEPTLTIEAKHKNAVQMPNFVHLMMASNEQWVVPAALDARRFCVFEVSEERKGDHAYFAAIAGEMQNDGYEAMLRDLLDYDLTFYNHRDVPVTNGLQTQRGLSLGAAEAWWLDVLHRGFVFRSRLGLEDYFGEWHDTVTTEVLFRSYTDYARARHERHPLARPEFGKFMIGMGAKFVRSRGGVVGERIGNLETAFGHSHGAELVKAERATGYHLGGLAAARTGFCRATGLTPDWPADGPEK